jgi:hypothetical protein
VACCATIPHPKSGNGERSKGSVKNLLAIGKQIEQFVSPLSWDQTRGVAADRAKRKLPEIAGADGWRRNGHVSGLRRTAVGGVRCCARRSASSEVAIQPASIRSERGSLGPSMALHVQAGLDGSS